MMISRRTTCRMALMIGALMILVVAASRLRADSGTCSGVSVTLPFNDVQGNAFFCSIAAAYFSGLTNGTSATAFSPSANVTREQMSAFITRTMDQSLRRGSRRAALNQWATPTSIPITGKTTVGDEPNLVACDGADLWVANEDSGTVSRVRASDGKLLETWTGATQAFGVVVARGRIFVTGNSNPSKLFVIDPTQPPGMVTTLADNLEPFAHGLAFAGYYIWVANNSAISRVDPITGQVTLFQLNTVIHGMIYDGSNIWVTDISDNLISKLNSSGSVVRSIAAGNLPRDPVFDGMNIWVPNQSSNSVTVVRVKDAAGNPLTDPFVLATLTGNGLDGPFAAAFDGERILVTNYSGSSVSLWRASDLSPLGFVTGAASARGACSDGLNFWVTQKVTPGKLVRF